MTLHIWGASDDLVEMRGMIDDEIDCTGARRVNIRIGDRVGVDMRYRSDTWTAEISMAGEDEMIPWPVAVRTDPDLCRYSVVVDVDCPDGTDVAATVVR